ncbi:alanine-phosphoribitol ligase [Mycobacterium sp. 852002-51971_SCH5477799-a]|uniref:SDR family NAD(P)-dependent oxidoreductase n=1 Tax=Mycobacterium sp. 852002-51971_SCH5477799-a TaxID=1834106 RepID=UPI0007FF3082|nr:SDR family NAD(P)-dependent oxidoreductase [Mycobacterium sp. 852002-51971_SCH5477799-a]OBF63519.1 alanine-phosphoribitol ligase [Mycobacterium sp. 852002-51971_SCH5477799-a]
MKTAVITGANRGLGLHCARMLLASDDAWHVVLAVRDPERGQAAAQHTGHPKRCSVIELDLASLQSARAFRARLTDAALPPLRALVCNAGVQIVSGTKVSADGIEMTFAVNHLGHFALVHDLLHEFARPARIVVVSSGTHNPAKHTGMPHPRYSCAGELAHPPAAEGDSRLGRRRYTTSKLCNVLFSYELDRRLHHGANGITVNAFDPGMMPGSDLARDYPPLQQFAWRFLLPALRILPGVRSTRTSGKALAALVADSRFDEVSGRYFDGAKAAQSSRDSYDRAKALDLWQTSERLAGITNS